MDESIKTDGRVDQALIKRAVDAFCKAWEEEHAAQDTSKSNDIVRTKRPHEWQETILRSDMGLYDGSTYKCNDFKNAVIFRGRLNFAVSAEALYQTFIYVAVDISRSLNYAFFKTMKEAQDFVEDGGLEGGSDE